MPRPPLLREESDHWIYTVARFHLGSVETLAELLVRNMHYMFGF
jgi:hypothetical protein